MSKKNIIFICIAIALVIGILIIYFAFLSNNSSNDSADVQMTLTKYDNHFEVEKVIEIADKKKINEINQIVENQSLEQDDTTATLAIRNDVKLDLGNDSFYMIQLDLEDYCYYSNSDEEYVIKMPDGLLNIINTILEENE